MLLILSDDHKDHLSFLTGVSADVAEEFCRISVEFLKKGVNLKIYQSAAGKLGESAETVQHGVEGLMHLLSEGTRLQLSEVDFADSVISLGFDAELQHVLTRAYLDNADEIRSVLREMAAGLPSYKDLEWRLDVQVASRALHNQVEPQLVLKLHLEDDGRKEVKVVQTDPVNLLHLTQSLEAALQEIKTSHCRRLLRNL